MALSDKKVLATQDDDIIDIEIAAIKRKKFRINGDPNKVIALNISDLGISDRLEKGFKNLQGLANKIKNTDPEDVKLSDELNQINDAMKKQIDYIFDADIADKLCDGGTMYDPHDGEMRYEHVIETLLKLYESNISREFTMMKRRVAKHTAKYTKPNTRKKK